MDRNQKNLNLILKNIQIQRMQFLFHHAPRECIYLFSLGIGKGDEVIVPAQTHTATAHAVELPVQNLFLLIVMFHQEILILNLLKKKLQKKRKQYV